MTASAFEHFGVQSLHMYDQAILLSKYIFELTNSEASTFKTLIDNMQNMRLTNFILNSFDKDVMNKMLNLINKIKKQK